MRNFFIRIIDAGWLLLYQFPFGSKAFTWLLNLWIAKYGQLETKVFSISQIKLNAYEIFIDIQSLRTGPLLLGLIFLTLIKEAVWSQVPGNKVILISALSEGQWFTLGKSFVITPDTTIVEFILYFIKGTANLDLRAYPVNFFDLIIVKVIGQPTLNGEYPYNGNICHSDGKHTQKRFYSTTPTVFSWQYSSLTGQKASIKGGSSYRLKSITPLMTATSPNQLIGVLDIETVAINLKHVPYAIGYKLHKPDGESILRIFYLTDYLGPTLEASQRIIIDILYNFLKEAKGYHIYVHNLGGFDGYLLLKELFKMVGNYKILIDQSKDVISIIIPSHKINIRDSLRIFPASLQELSIIFKTPVPKGNLDHSKVTESLLTDTAFKIEALNYLSQDLISLLDIILNATKTIHTRYSVDLSRAFSTASLAITIFRTGYLKFNIPILSIPIDSYIRKSFIGGATEVYICRGKNLYYYDVNSLYPYAIKQPIPYNCLGYRKGSEINLTEFFGFIQARIIVPSKIKIPILPWKDPNLGKLLYPRGCFTGYYFSEELKAAQKLGYIIQPLSGYEFDKIDLFSDYVDYHYALKAESVGAERFITKLLLNGLYGFFGRNPQTWIAEILPNDQATELLFTNPAYECFPLDDSHIFVLADSKPSNVFLNAQKISFLEWVKSNKRGTVNSSVISNVAIASAITAYA